VAESLVCLLPERVRSLLPPRPGLAVGIHDVGKVSPGYELKHFEHTVVAKHAPGLVGQASFCTHHASIGAAAVDRWLETEPMESAVALAVAAHHGSADRGYPPDQTETLGGAAWAEERRKLLAQLCSIFDGDLRDSVDANPQLLAGLTCVADWIGSDESFFPADGPPVCEGDAARTAAFAVAACGFTPLALKPGLSFRDVFGFEPRGAQAAFLERVTGPGLYILEAPMGLGKTEAALYAAYRLMEAGHHHGIYFALPTRLTSDRIHARVGAFLQRIVEGPVAPVLAHGMAWLRAYEHGGEGFGAGSSWFHPMKRALLHPFAVGTIDQALLGVLNVKHSFVRLFGLAGKVVVLDEVHSYDMYTGTLLDELATRLRSIGCTVIVLSATLTGKRRSQLAPALRDFARSSDYPLLSGQAESAPPFAAALPAPPDRSHRVRLAHWDVARVAQAVVAAAERGACVICIANTVAKAQAWYKAVLSARRGDAFPVGILHARFPLFRREELEEEWLARLGPDSATRPRGCVLVATQIVEQSVDLDADWMISELAPTDMLLQRMGRLWRHARANRPLPDPELRIITGDPAACTTAEEVLQALGKENCCVYAPYVLMRTHEVWRSLDAATLPGDIRPLIEATYAERTEPAGGGMADLQRLLECRADTLRKLALSAQDTVHGMPCGVDDERAATRHSDLPTTTVLLLDAVLDESPWFDRARLRLADGSEWSLCKDRPDFGATRALHRCTLSVASYLLPNRGDIGIAYPWLDKHFHQRPVVLVRREDGRLAFHRGPPTTLAYSPEYGVWRTDAPAAIAAPRPVLLDQTEDDVFDPLTKDW
jgi:CRISPR-associated endonuclease/helicase Cas3